LLVSAAPFAPLFIDHAHKFAVATMQQNNQAENRFALWREALEIGMEANMLGLGPGPHLVNSSGSGRRLTNSRRTTRCSTCLPKAGSLPC
jgi:hypothetical protein